MIYKEYVAWYSILQVAVVLGWMQFDINPCNDSDLLLFLFSGSINSLQQIWYFSAASCPLFNTSVNPIIGYCRNIAYNSFISSSKCTLQTSLHNLYHGKSSLDQELLHKQTCYVHTIQTLNVLIFSGCGILHFRSVVILLIFYLCCSSTSFSMLSMSAYRINGTLKSLSQKTSWLWRARSSVNWRAYCTFC